MEFKTFFTAPVLQIQDKIFLPFYKDFNIHERINLKNNFRLTGVWVKTSSPNEKLTDIERDNQCYTPEKFKKTNLLNKIPTQKK